MWGPREARVPIFLGVLSGGGLASPGEGVPGTYTDEAVARGISLFVGGVPSAGCGLAFADLDGDGDPDLVALGGGTLLRLYENDGSGHFTDRSDGVPRVADGTSVIAADYDADGDLDLYVGTFQTPPALLRNDGDFAFVDVATQAGITTLCEQGGSCWGDYDCDGWLDLYVACVTPESGGTLNELYRNRGDGTFEPVAASLGVADANLTWQAVFLDYDGDADADLYLSNDKGYLCADVHNFLYRNDCGVLVDVTEEAGAEACIASMGVAVGDFDGNRHQDLYLTNVLAGNVLLLNQGDGTFARGEAEAGVQAFAFGWGAAFYDYDNDGNLDLYVNNQSVLNRLYRNSGSWPTVDVAAQTGVASTGGFSYCCAVADVDGDGDLDLAVTDEFAPLSLFIYHSVPGRHWSRLRVEGTGPNRFAVGARVEIEAGGRLQVREVVAGSNLKAQNELTLHFGLGITSSVDRITVTWPGGASRELRNYPADRRWTLYPTERLGDANADGEVDHRDFLRFASCYFEPGGAMRPGCEMMDLDGDADVDFDDYLLFVAIYPDSPEMEPR